MADEQKLKKIVDDIVGLPTLPTVLTNVTKMMQNPRVSAAEVGRVIQSDVSLTSKILKLVNSAFYGFPSRISTVTHAIVILGFNAVKSTPLCKGSLQRLTIQCEYSLGTIQETGARLWGGSAAGHILEEHVVTTGVVVNVAAPETRPLGTPDPPGAHRSGKSRLPCPRSRGSRGRHPGTGATRQGGWSVDVSYPRMSRILMATQPIPQGTPCGRGREGTW